MFMPSRYIRIWSLMITLATLAGCADEGSLVGPDVSPSFVRGGNGGGNGGGGNGGGDDGDSGNAPVVEDFDLWDPSAWFPATTRSAVAGSILKTSATGAARSSSRFPGVMTAPRSGPPRACDFAMSRSVCARRRRQDRSPRSSCTSSFCAATPRSTWRSSTTDPGRSGSPPGLADSRPTMCDTLFPSIPRWGSTTTGSSGRAAGYVSCGRRAHARVDGGNPRDAMYVMSNAWWPIWLDEPPLGTPRLHEIDRIVY